MSSTLKPDLASSSHLNSRWDSKTPNLPGSEPVGKFGSNGFRDETVWRKPFAPEKEAVEALVGNASGERTFGLGIRVLGFSTPTKP